LTGAERIMRKFDHAVFYVDVHRIRRGYYEGEFKLMTREPKQKEEYELTTIYYQMLEESIKRAPAYWLWSHDRWSRTREEFNRRFEVVDGKVVKRQEGKKEG
ncbi:MAG: acetyltransferase, partial [Prevotella sp.]|nr:acetyltransferase [Prevotella sp.]